MKIVEDDTFSDAEFREIMRRDLRDALAAGKAFASNATWLRFHAREVIATNSKGTSTLGQIYGLRLMFGATIQECGEQK